MSSRFNAILSRSNAVSDSPEDVLWVLSWNIDSNVGMVHMGPNRDAFPEYSSAARMERIIWELSQKIDLLSPPLIHIQEGRRFTLDDGTQLDSVTPVVEFLSSRGYQVLTQNYLDGDDKSFVYITAFLPQVFSLVETNRWYMTRTTDRPTDRSLPREEILHNNFGELFERCVFHVTLRRKATGEIVHSVNVHLGIGGDYRVAACEILHSIVDGFLTASPESYVVCTGDFNAFPDWKGPEQIDVLRRPLTCSISHSVLVPHPWTFIPSPYDLIGKVYGLFLRPSGLSEQDSTPIARRKAMLDVYSGRNLGSLPLPPAIGGALDLVVSCGFQSEEVMLVLTPTNPELFNEIVGTGDVSESAIREYIMRCAESDTPYAAWASDHQKVIARFKWRPVRRSVQ
jgi:hypothetical protein